MIPLKFPFTMGGDFSGVVIQLGDGVYDFKIGDKVYGQALVLNGGSGAFAQFAASNAANTSLMPKSVSFLQAAALPLVGGSAIQALEEHIKLKRDPTSAKASAGKQKILIHGGAGGIGHIAVQLAKHLGAHVAATASGDSVKLVKKLGADEAIDYKTQKFEEILHDFDAVFDTVGGEITDRSFKVLKRSGIIVSMLGAPNPALAKQYGVTAIGQNTRVDNKILARLTEFVEQGAIEAQVDKVFPLEQVREAFEYLENSHPRGKVVVKIKE